MGYYYVLDNLYIFLILNITYLDAVKYKLHNFTSYATKCDKRYTQRLKFTEQTTIHYNIWGSIK